MELRYSKIASISIWHNYFLLEGVVRQSQIPRSNNISEYIDIVPSTETLQLIKNYRLKLLKTSNGIDIYGESTLKADVLKSISQLNSNVIFCFSIVVKRNKLIEITVIEESLKNKVFYFSNTQLHTLSVSDGDGGNEDVNYIFKKPTEFNLANTYSIDKIVFNNNNSFLSLSNQNNKALTNDDFWRKLEDSSYANSFKKTINTSTYRTPASLSLKGKKIEIKNILNEVVYELDNIKTDELSVDIQSIPQGSYNVNIDGVNEDNFIKTNSKGLNIGFIEIVHHGNVNELNHGVVALSKEKLLVGNGFNTTIKNEILVNKWVIRFLNRTSVWKYFFKSPQNFDNTELAAAGFKKVSELEIESETHMALTEAHRVIDAGLGYMLPNPTSDSLKILVNNKKVEKYITELYVNT